MSRASAPRPGRRLIAAVMLAVAALATTAFVRALTDDGGREVRAEFSAVNGLRGGDPVRVAGIDVGEVAGIRLQRERGAAEVSMRIDEDVALTRSARATMRWRNLLGGSRYIDLDPGATSTGAAAGAPATLRIPRSRTASQVEFDDVMQPFDGGTARAAQQIVGGLDAGLADPGAVGKTIDALSPSLRAVRRGLRPLRGTRAGDLAALVRATARTAAALGRRDRRLGELVAGAAGTLEATAARRAELGRAIELSPAALDETRAAAARIEATLGRLDPLVAQLRPGARRLDPTLRAADPALERTASILREAEPLLRSLGPSVRALGQAVPSGLRVIDGYNPVLRRLDQELLPWLERRDPDTARRTSEMIGPTAAAAADAAREFDGGGHWARLSPSFGEHALLPAPCSTFLTDPSREERLRCDELERALAELFGGSR